MLQWISANIGTILISLVLLAVVTLIIRNRESPPAAATAPAVPHAVPATIRAIKKGFPEFLTPECSPQTLSADCISLCMF